MRCPPRPSDTSILASPADTSILASPATRRSRLVRAGLRFSARAPERIEWKDAARSRVWAHRGHCLSAVRQNGKALRHADEALKGDSLVAYEAIRNHSAAFHFAPARIKGDRDFALELVWRDGLALQHLAPRWQDDDEIVTEAVLQNGWAFRFASARLRADRELVAIAVEAHGRNLVYVSDEQLRRDRDLLLRCVSRNGLSAATGGRPIRRAYTG